MKPWQWVAQCGPAGREGCEVALLKSKGLNSGTYHQEWHKWGLLNDKYLETPWGGRAGVRHARCRPPPDSLVKSAMVQHERQKEIVESEEGIQQPYSHSSQSGVCLGLGTGRGALLLPRLAARKGHACDEAHVSNAQRTMHM